MPASNGNEKVEYVVDGSHKSFNIEAIIKENQELKNRNAQLMKELELYRSLPKSNDELGNPPNLGLTHILNAHNSATEALHHQFPSSNHYLPHQQVEELAPGLSNVVQDEMQHAHDLSNEKSSLEKVTEKN